MLMLSNLFNAFFDVQSVDKLIFYYSGEISQNVISSMSESLKLQLTLNHENNNRIKKVFSSYVEMMQNVILHSPEPLTGKEGAMLVCKVGDEYIVACANYVLKQGEQELRKKLEPFQNMNISEIKQAYRDQLKKDDVVGQGAGLGFYTVARDSTKPIEYGFADVEGHETELSYFYLKATL